ncbi:MAG: PIN domain-containing protein, partial [Spirochaetaceae bacterium]|nr:PIN domain-containing protein [Spirochaetaceae bacterium]
MVKPTVIIDTNAIVSFFMGDVSERNSAIAHILAAEKCVIPVEVISETVFILEKRFNLSRQDVAEKIKDIITIKDDLVACQNVVRFACNTFASTKLDFVDCLLDGYAKING